MACLPSTWRPCLAAEGTGLLGALATRGKDFKLRAAAAGTLKACARSRVPAPHVPGPHVLHARLHLAPHGS